MKSLETTLKAYRDRIEAAIPKWIPPTRTKPAILHEAMAYMMEAGGKRLRPVLVLAAHDLFPGPADPMPAAVAIECLHTYSLIHDDLPCMDDSALRRGKPTCHVQFDEVTALLAGDALLTHAFYLLGEGYHTYPEKATALLRELGRAAGSRHLIGGQVEDTLNEGKDLTPEQLDFIHLNKTAALLSASLTMGLIIGEAPSGAPEQARLIGRNLGLTFQIVDDILDATSDDATLGKTAGADAAREKNTYVKIHGLEASRQHAAHLTKEALDLLRSWKAETQFLEELVASLEHRIK